MSSRASRRFKDAMRLFALVVAATLVALALSQYSMAGTLFQSPPVSPPPQPAEPAPPQPAPSPTPVPVEVAPPQPEAPSESETTADPAPPETVPVEPLPEEPTVANPPIADPNAGEAAPPSPTAEPLAAPADPSTELRHIRLERRDGRGQEGEPNFILNEAQMVDSFIIYGAWVWLCCGVIVFLLIPLAFLFLQIRGRSQILKEEAL